MNQDQNLLFGVMAVQLKFLTPQQLMEAAAAWAMNRERSLRDVLLERGMLTQKVAQMLDGLLAVQVDAHGGDVAAALQSFGGTRAVHASFAASSALFDLPAEEKKEERAKEQPAEEQEQERTLMEALESFGGESFPGRVSAPELESVSTGEAAAHPPAESDSPEKLTFEHPGRYTITREHARGGIGRILLAFDSHIGRRIAVKELLPFPGAGTPSSENESRKTNAARLRFLREARITGQLEHPSIVPVYEIGRRTDGTVYYTMRFVRGKTLAKAIREAKSYEERIKLLTHFHNLCNAIRYAHSRGVIHRDIKPHNVMVGEFGETVVLDWGLAKVRGKKDARASAIERELRKFKEYGDGTQTMQGVPLGTPAYMSPEQAEGRIDQVDERSDIWSLGVVLYEILTGKLPFGDDNEHPLVIMGRVLKDDPRPILLLEPKASEELAAVAMKCLEKDPARRYQTAEHLAEDIEQYLTGGLVSVYDYSRFKLFKRWFRKWWPVVVTATAAVVLLVVVFAWSYVNILREQRVALNNIAEAYLANGWWAAAEGRWNTARLFFSKSLAMSDRQSTRYALNYARTMPGTPLRLRQVLVEQGHEGKVNELAVSPEGNFLLSAGEDRKVILWDLQKGEALAAWTRHKAAVKTVVFSPNGKQAASADEQGLICLWSVEGRSLESCFAGSGTGQELAVNLLRVSPDGKFLAAAGEDSVIVLINLETKEKKDLQGHTGKIWALNFSPDSSWLASGSRDMSVRVWNPETGEALLVFKNFTNSVSNVLFLPGSRLLASSWDRSLKIWSLPQGTLLYSGKEAHVPVFLLLLNSSSLPSAGTPVLLGYEDGFLQLLDADHCQCQEAERECGCRSLRTWGNVHRGQLLQLVLLNDQGLLVSVGADSKIKFWNLNSPASTNIVEGFGTQKIAAAADGKTLVTAGPDGMIRVWALSPDGVKRVSLERSVTDAVLDKSGRFVLLAGSDGKIVKLHPLTGELQGIIHAHAGSVSALALSADGRDLISVGRDGKVLHWDLKNLSAETPLEPLAGHTAHGAVDFITAAITPDGRLAVSADFDGEQKTGVIILWDLRSHRIVHRLEEQVDNLKRVIAVSPDGRLLAAGLEDGRFHVWDLATGNLRFELSAHTLGARAAAFSPDGKLLATAGKDQKAVLWDPATGQRLHVLARGHTHWLRLLHFSPDGKFLITGGVFDNTINFWSAERGEKLCSRVLNDRPLSLAFWPDNSDRDLLQAAVGTRDGDVWIVRARADERGMCETVLQMSGHPGSVENLLSLSASSGVHLISGDNEGQVMLWPFPAEMFTEEAEALSQAAQADTGLSVEGMELTPWHPGRAGQLTADERGR